VEEFQAHAEAMVQQSMTDAEFARMTAQLFPAPDRDAPARTHNAHLDRQYILNRLVGRRRHQAAIRGTKWAGYQAVAEYIDHHSPVRTRGDKATARAVRLLTTTEPARDQDPRLATVHHRRLTARAAGAARRPPPPRRPPPFAAVNVSPKRYPY
jgi:hypothetical protein